LAKSIESFFLILGDNLFPLDQVAFSKKTPLLMIEDHGLCTHYRYHKHKIIFFLSSMREYARQLSKARYSITYLDAEHDLFKKPFVKKLDWFLKENKKVSQIETYQINDSFFRKIMDEFVKKNALKWVEHPSPMFLTPPDLFKDYIKKGKRPFMMTFYQRQRKQLNLLLDKKGEPVGGRWSFDTENRKKYPKNIMLPLPPKPQSSDVIKKVSQQVDRHFKTHPGLAEQFWLPTTRSQAQDVLKDFVKNKFQNFGPYEDAIRSDDVFGYHSQLSMLINNGLLTPNEVIDYVIIEFERKNLPIESVEGFVRQVVGWREFMKGIYDHFEQKMWEDNYWGHMRSFTLSWYEGATGLPPLDDSIRKLQQYGYAHHIERLMVQSNIMLLCEIHPREVYRWFMEMYVDSADWVMMGNVFGMGQMSEGGIFATKPYICGSNYLLKMSDYKKADWCDTLDGLYWRFIDKHKNKFNKNPRMSMMVKMRERIEPKRWRHIQSCANDFLSEHTLVKEA
jgi:deoxyribodipyrimidine photolyase-related protein